MKGYIKTTQWHAVGAKHLTDIYEVEKHSDGGKAIDSMIGWHQPPIMLEQPYCDKGHVVFRVEDDGTLVKVDSNYDSGD